MDIPWSPVQRRRLEELQASGPEAAAEIDRLFSGEVERDVAFQELERRLEDKRVLKVRHPEEAASSRSSGGGTLPDDWEETGKQMIRDDIDLEFIKKHTVPGERNGDVAADRRLQRRLQLLQDALDCLLRILCQLPITCPGMLAPIRHMGTCFRCQVLHRARKMGLLRNDAPDEARSRG